MTDREPTDDHSRSVWVRSDRSADGAYVVTVELGPDHSRVIDRADLLDYVLTVIRAAEVAAYDAAVAVQFRTLNGGAVSLRDVAATVNELRKMRGDLDQRAIAPLSLQPGVSATTGRPFLAVSIAGRIVGQWDTAQAADHAGAVLSAHAVTELDDLYRQYLINSVGLDEATALRVVHGLRAHRTGA
jgi:hypothetical protein